MAWDFDPANITDVTLGGTITGTHDGWAFTNASGQPTLETDGVRFAGADVTATRGSQARAAEFTLHMIVRVDAVTSFGNGTLVQWITTGLNASQITVSAGDEGWVANWYSGFFVELQSPELPFGTPVLLTVAQDDDALTMYVNGEQVATSENLLGTASGSNVVVGGHSAWDWTVYRALGTDEVAEDLATDMTDLIALYEIPTSGGPGLGSGLTGTAAVEVTARGVLLTRDVHETPTVPAPSAGGSRTPPAPPEPQSPPTGVPDPVVWRVSEIMPAPTLDSRGNPVNWTPTSVVRSLVGRFQIVVEGTDITYIGGAPTPIPTWSSTDPFGPATATIRLPQVSPFHPVGEGDLSWCKGGANVDILLAGTKVFEGVVVSFGHDERGSEGEFTLTCLGALYQADLQLRKPAFTVTPQDMGAAIKAELDSVISRRYAQIPLRVLGIATSVRGGWEPKLTGRTQQLLSTAVTGGQQWTVTCLNREPELVPRDVTGVHWHVANGARGVKVEVSQDWSQAPNAIYGEGIGPDGGRWRNSKYPNWRPDDTPPYPFNNPARLIGVGTTDAMTDTGNGVSLWQARVGQPVTGVFSRGDQAALRWLQSQAGIQVDGSLGPQSWAATFATGSNTGSLEGAWVAPLAEAPAVAPRLYAADGADLGPNPDYNPNVLRVERYYNFGEGVTKEEGRRAAAEILARDISPGWVGTITLRTDPEEGSRFFIRENHNIAVRYFRGTTLQLHVAAVDHSAEETVLTVDTHARDFPTLDAIRQRERDAVDPARAYVSPKGRSRQPQDMPTFDAEAGGGLVPRHALFANLWTVIRIPVAAYGQIVRADFHTSPATPFSLAIFNRPITAARLLQLVGNPLVADKNPWNDAALDDAGLIMAWGWAKQPCGYWPGFYSDPDGEGADPLTGRFIDDAGVEYASTAPPWLWVAQIASSSCYIEGRFYQGPVD
jgi:peptidoglycan hydrolase-like protein with peptidoglycan-binding domain